MSTFHTTRAEELKENWDRLIEVTTTVLISDARSSREASISQDELSKYLLMFNDIRHDRVVPSGGLTSTMLLGLYRAPGSKNRHHNVEGGLVKHLLQMWGVWMSMRPLLREAGGSHPLLTDENIWKCILHHDLNKVWKYKLFWPELSPTPALEYAGELDRMTYFLGDTNKTICILGKYGITLNIPLLNALVNAEGGYSPGPRTQTETVLAKLAYLLDEMSANVIDRLQFNRFWDSKEGGVSEVS
jgi:hypothetical protein